MMDRVISTHIFSKQTLAGEQLDRLAATGAQAVEVRAATGHFDYTHRPAVRELAAYFSGSEIRLHSLHAPMYREESGDRERNNVVHRERSQRIAAMDEIKRAIEVAEQVPFRFMVLHLDEYEEPWSESVMDRALTAVEHLQAFARPLGVAIALENLCNEVAQAENLLRVLRVGHFKDAGLCFDSGHGLIVAARRAREKSSAYAADGSVTATRDAVLAEYMAMLELMSPRVLTTHLHDNDALRDAHLWPGDEAVAGGGVDWAGTMRLLRGASLGPAANLEIHWSLGSDAVVRGKAAFGMLESTAVEETVQ